MMDDNLHRRHRRTARLVAGLAVGALFAAAVPTAPALAQGAQGAAPPRPTAEACAALAGLKVEDTNLLSATVVPAAGDLPAYCRVLGYVRPSINFEIRLPTETWNGKSYVVGCGGFCGRLESDRPNLTNAMNFGLRRNYVAAVSDAGHWGAGSADGRWAWNNRLGEVDWGFRAIPELSRVTKAMVAAYYGRPQQRNYFAGCSTGGRQALMAAIRNPREFDGIIAGAPALDYTGLVATFLAWTTQANTGPDGRPIFPHTKTPLVRDAVMKACDATDGIEDGLIDDPRKCSFDPASLRCPAGQSGDQCLTSAEVDVLKKWYQGPRNAAGQQLYPGGIPLSSEPFWGLWLTGSATAPALNPLFTRDFLRYMAFQEDPGDGYQVGQFDFEKDPARLAHMGAIYNATDPNLSAFREAGGKLLIYHGWSDAIVTPQRTVDHYEAMVRTNGGRAQTEAFARLFMIPGFDHCGLTNVGPGISETGLDPLAALESWVEGGTAPASLTTRKTDAQGQVQWTRPACPYPQVPRRQSQGNPREAASFACVDP